jgi:hypothetical protein
MDEFGNRMSAQRHILAIVNNMYKGVEELCGLSENAISRWTEVNRLQRNSEVVRLLRQSAELLFFLATKSQDQVTEEYETRMQDVAKAAVALETALQQFPKHAI